MHTHRLEQLAQFLRALPASKFNFAILASAEGKATKPLACPAVGCAMGWMPAAFPRQGLYLRRRRYHSALSLYSRKLSEDEMYWTVAAHFFDISYWESRALFDPEARWTNRAATILRNLNLRELGKNATPREVAENLMRFVRRRSFSYAG